MMINKIENRGNFTKTGENNTALSDNLTILNKILGNESHCFGKIKIIYTQNEIKISDGKTENEIFNEDIQRLYIPVRNKITNLLNQLQDKNLGKCILDKLNRKCDIYWSNGDFKNILREILINAIQAGETAQTIIEIGLFLNQSNNNFEILIIDNGKGFNEEDKFKLFEYGFTTKINHIKGTVGKGLFYCQNQLAHTMQGQIQIFNNKTFNIKGTSLLISIPLNPDQ